MTDPDRSSEPARRAEPGCSSEPGRSFDLPRFAWHPEPELIGYTDPDESRAALERLGGETLATALDYLYGEAMRRPVGPDDDPARPLITSHDARSVAGQRVGACGGWQDRAAATYRTA